MIVRKDAKPTPSRFPLLYPPLVLMHCSTSTGATKKSEMQPKLRLARGILLDIYSSWGCSGAGILLGRLWASRKNCHRGRHLPKRT